MERMGRKVGFFTWGSELSTEARVNAEAHDCYLAGINVSDPSLILNSCLFGMVRIFEGKS